MRTTGTHVVDTTLGRPIRAFVPFPLPPDPPLDLNPTDQDLLDQANRAIGRLDGAAALLPDLSLFTYAYVRKEAVVSSQIEGTQSSLSDLLLHEDDQAPGVPIDDVTEVSNYVAALHHGMQRLSEGFPLSIRLLKEIHHVLLADGRGSGRSSGELRKGHVWIGGATPETAKFVPPPWTQVEDCLGHLERFLHDDPVRTPALLKAGLAHAQFETIHPFMDGNGRLGRLLITLLLCEENALSAPILYLSLYLKGNRLEYYERLQRVRTHGDWEGWVRFFLKGVKEVADHALDTTRRILRLFESDRMKLQGLGQAASSALRVHERLQHKPIMRITELASSLGLSYPAVSNAMERMVALGIVRELTGYTRNRVFAYAPYIAILGEGAEPLES